MYVQPDHVNSLVEITGKQPFECIEALSNSVTFDAAVIKLLEVDEKLVSQMRCGSIITSISNNDFLEKGEPTKIVAKFKKNQRAWLEIDGRIQDRVKFYMDHLFVENLHKTNKTSLQFTYLNKRVYMLPIYRFRPASEEEKKLYHKLSKEYKTF